MALFPSLINRGALAGCWARTASDSGGSDPSDPEVTAAIEIKSADGILLVTADGNYLATET